MLGLALGRETEKAWSRPVGAGDSLCDGSEGRIGFAIEPIAVVDYLDLVGPAIPLADEMGAGRNGPCGSAGAWCCILCYLIPMMEQQDLRSTTALNVREFPAELLWQLKEAAARERLTLREYVIKVLRKALASAR